MGGGGCETKPTSNSTALAPAWNALLMALAPTLPLPSATVLTLVLMKYRDRSECISCVMEPDKRTGKPCDQTFAGRSHRSPAAKREGAAARLS